MLSGDQSSENSVAIAADSEIHFATGSKTDVTHSENILNSYASLRQVRAFALLSDAPQDCVHFQF